MSNGLAVAAVTRVLQGLVQHAAGAVVPGVSVLTRRPAKVADDEPAGASVNLFLFQVTPNDLWRNEDLPTRTADGTVRQPPRLAVDLHYMLSFHGDDAALVPQRMLGEVLGELHRGPRLTAPAIRAAVAAAGPDGPLARSDLADQLESITLTLQRPSLEELSKIWSVMFQVPYVLSIFYVASVVVIQPDTVTAPAVEVAEDGVRVAVAPGTPR